MRVDGEVGGFSTGRGLILFCSSGCNEKGYYGEESLILCIKLAGDLLSLYLFVRCRGIYAASGLAYLNWFLANKGYLRYTTLVLTAVKIVSIMWS